MSFDVISLDISLGGWSDPELIERRGLHAMGSGGSSGDTYDAEYNARIATIAESEEAMAQEYFDFWESDYKPMEQAEIKANLAMMPSETAMTIAQNEAATSLIPTETALAQAQNESALALLPWQADNEKRRIADENVAMEEFAPVRSSFYQEAMDGVDVESRANKAAADAVQSFMNADASSRRDAARMGVDPNSGRFAAMNTANAMEQAKTVAGAKTTAREDAENENFDRLSTAMNFGYGGTS